MPTKVIIASFADSVSGSIFMFAGFSVFSWTCRVTFGTMSSMSFVGRLIVIPSYFSFASCAVEIAFLGSNPSDFFSSKHSGEVIEISLPVFEFLTTSDCAF